MQPPFTHDQFLDVFADYNRALWPALLALWLATAWGLSHLYRGRPGASRVVAALLSLHWAWSGAVYHLIYFRRINPAAALFGVAFLTQAGLLLWRGVVRQRLTFDRKRPRWGPVALVLVLYALVYPALGLVLGLRAPRFPSFGVPCPTAILTAGLLLLAPRREARLLGIIPVLWAAIGGSAAFLLGVRADMALVLAGLLLVAYLVTPERSHPDTRAAAPARPRS